MIDAVDFPEEGHGFYKSEQQLEALQRTVDWFDKYLKGKPVAAAWAR